MKELLIPILLITLVFTSCSGEDKTVCDCLAEETAAIQEAGKTDYKDYEPGDGLSDECQALYEEMKSDPAKKVTFYAERKECPEYKTFDKEFSKMVDRKVQIDVENDPEFQKLEQALDELANE